VCGVSSECACVWCLCACMISERESVYSGACKRLYRSVITVVVFIYRSVYIVVIKGFGQINSNVLKIAEHLQYWYLFFIDILGHRINNEWYLELTSWLPPAESTPYTVGRV